MAFSSTSALGYLRRAHKQNRLAHAYLISGPPGSGKQLLAAELASLVNRTAANAFFKTLEEPPKDSLLLLLSALPEALPDTILSRCIAIPLAPGDDHDNKPEEEKLVKLLQEAAHEQSWSIQYAYRLAQGFQRLLRGIREEIKDEIDQALKKEETRYKNATDGVWLEEREEYYKALTESLYLQRRAGLIETLFAWWSDVLRSSSGVDRRDLPDARKETGALAKRFTIAEVLRRVRCLEELRDHLNRNIQEALAVEVAFLT